MLAFNKSGLIFAQILVKLDKGGYRFGGSQPSDRPSCEVLLGAIGNMCVQAVIRSGDDSSL